MINEQILICLTYIVKKDVNSILLVVIQAIEKKSFVTFERLQI
jgi:hypothetical protein